MRVRILLALLAHGEMYEAELAVAARTTPQRIAGAMRGDDDYRRDCALLRLGLVARCEDVVGARFSLTPRGRAVARQWQRVRARESFQEGPLG